MLKSFGRGITSLLSSFGRGITSLLSSFGHGITSLLSSFGRGITSLLNSFGRGITSLLSSFGRGITSLLSSFGRGTPCLLSKWWKYYSFCVQKPTYMNNGDDLHLLPFHTLIFCIKNSRFQHSNFSKLDKMIYNSMSDTCSIIFVPKMGVKWYFF